MKRHLNLLPWKLRCRILLRQRIRQWTMAWGILATVAVLLYAKNWHGLSAAHHQLEVWHRRAVAVETINDKNETLRREIAGLKERLVKYGHLESEQVGFQLLATISQSTGSVSSPIQVQKLTFKQFQIQEKPVETKETPKDPKAPPKLRDVRTLSLSGVATNNLAVAQFVATLRDSGAFHTVDLKSSQDNKLAAAGSRTYQVECSF